MGEGTCAIAWSISLPAPAKYCDFEGCGRELLGGTAALCPVIKYQPFAAVGL